MDDRRRDGGTNSTLRTKEQGTHLTLNEHDDDDDDYDDDDDDEVHLDWLATVIGPYTQTQRNSGCKDRHN